MDTARTTALTEKITRSLLLLVGIAYVALDLAVIFSRIHYKFELEWLEGDSLVAVSRILAGQGLYVKPSVEFVSLIYPPLYFYAGALFARILGFGFWPLRLVSLISSLACGALLFFAIRERTSARASGILSVGCFASLFMISGQWYDIARVDMLSVALALAGLILVREREAGRNPWLDFTAGVLFSLAFLTKQHALIIFLILAGYYLFFNRRVLLRLGLGFVLTTAVLFGIFELLSQGWMGYYLFQVPAGHSFDIQIGSIISALISEFLPVPGFLVVALLPVLVAPRQVLADRTFRYYFIAALGLMVMGTFGYLNKYATRNVFIPSYLGLALLIGLESNWWLDRFQKMPAFRWGWLLLVAEWLVLLAQFGRLLNPYLVERTLPSQADLAAGNNLVKVIQAMPGNVLIPRFGYLDLFAGKQAFYGEIAMSEFRGQGNQYPLPEWPALHAQIVQTIHSPQTSAILLDYPAYMQADLAGCKKQQIAYPGNTTFIPVAGANSRPNFIFSCQ